MRDAADAVMASAEIDAYAVELSWILTQIGLSLDGLSGTQLTKRPVATGNTPYMIANHVIGATRAYVLGFACRTPVPRDRRGEFASPATSVDEVSARLRILDVELKAGLSQLTPGELDEHLIPTRELWGTGPIGEISRREALIEAVRHAALHLGELRLTRDLIVAADSP